MKLQENMVRLKMFQVRERKRKIAQIEMMTIEFQRRVLELEEQIVNEERKSGNNNIHHFAYSALARAARQRRDNLMDSIHDLQIQKANTEIALREVEIELQHAQALEKLGGKAAVGDGRIFIKSC